MKRIINLNRNWLFSNIEPRNFATILEKPEQITLPHIWGKENDNDGEQEAFQKGFYQRDLPVPAELDGFRLFLEFNGAKSACEVYIGGKQVGIHIGGYSAFRFEITDYVKPGNNHILTVAVDSSDKQDDCVLCSEFDMLGGLYRDVNLIVVGKTHFALEDNGSQGVYITTQVEGTTAFVNIKAIISNPVNYDVVSFTIYDSADNAVGTATAHPKQASATISFQNPILWNGLLAPYLYSLRAQLIRDGVILDQTEVSFGIRSIEIKSDSGLYLNGVKTRLYGVSRYQDRKNVGIAVTRDHEKEDVTIIKDLGANSVILLNGQHSQSFLERCDKEGIIVIAQIAIDSEAEKESKAYDEISKQITELINQNYNHPSIIGWSIKYDAENSDNEIIEFISELNSLIKSLDSSRFSVFENNISSINKSELSDITDTLGFCIHTDLDWDKTKGYIDSLSECHSKKENLKIALTAYGKSTSNIEIIDEHYSVEEKQSDYHEKIWNKISNDNYMWGSFVFTLFDFSSAEKCPSCDKDANNSGLVSFDRKTKKDAYFFYKSQWSSTPFVHITERKNPIRTERKVSIKVYSNQKSVTLVVNNKNKRSITLESENGVFIFNNVLLSRGENKVNAFSGDNGEITDEIIIIRQKN